MSKGTDTVLLVEDEEAIRRLIRVVLQSYGYTILEARHGEDALAIAQQHPGTIDIVVTDMLMPGMGGRQLADQLRRTWPGLRVLLMSGYPDDLREGESPVAFLSKTFTPVALARKVRQVLDGDGTA